MILKSMRSCIKMVTSIHKKPDLMSGFFIQSIENLIIFQRSDLYNLLRKSNKQKTVVHQLLKLNVLHHLD